MTFGGVSAKLVKGHGVASGKTKDSRFPEGTISMQVPHFRQRGLDLSNFYLGSLNLDISPYSFVLQRPDFSFSQVKWSPDLQAENFSFYTCILEPIKDGNDSTSYEGLSTGRIRRPNLNSIKIQMSWKSLPPGFQILVMEIS